MKRKLFLLFTIFSFALVFISNHLAFATTNIADGKYTIPYTVLKGDNDSASMANDYFSKPATLNVANGNIEVQIKIKQSDWVKSLNVENKAVKVVNEDKAAGTKIVSFNVSDISKTVNAKMHVLIEEYDYDHNYTVRFSFDQSSLKALDVKQSAAPINKDTEAKTVEQSVGSGNSNVVMSEQVESNPKTGDSTTTTMMVLFVILGSALYFLYRLKVRRNE